MKKNIDFEKHILIRIHEKMFNSKILIKNILAAIPVSTLATITHTNLIIPYYHMVSDNTILHIKHLYPHKNIKQFNSDMDFLLKEFNPITLHELLKFSRNEQKLPPRALLLTFDDGFREMHDIVAAILLRKGIPAAFFVNSNFTDNRNLCYQHKASVLLEDIQRKNVPATARKQTEALLLQHHIKSDNITAGILAINYQQRHLVDQIAALLGIDFNNYLQKNQPYMTTDQILRLLKDGFTIGAHSIDHPLYVDLTLKEQIRQTMESVRMVRDTFNLDYGAFAFPHSDNGVSKEYFNQIEKSGLVDVSFGTSGIIKDYVPHHFQRFSLEKPLRPAKNILAYQYAKRLWRIIKHEGTIKRK
jgi:peptidoglycan/xylan/chitin deacetylase (PgdA/CDA1 family)